MFTTIYQNKVLLDHETQSITIRCAQPTGEGTAAANWSTVADKLNSKAASKQLKECINGCLKQE